MGAFLLLLIIVVVVTADKKSPLVEKGKNKRGKHIPKEENIC